MFQSTIPMPYAPAEVLGSVQSGGDDLVWLDSAIGHPDRGRRSALCLELSPALRIESNRFIIVGRDGERRDLSPHKGWEAADRALERDAREGAAELGWCGYVAYEAGPLADPALPTSVHSLPFPMMRFDRVLAALLEDERGCRVVAEGATPRQAKARAERWAKQLRPTHLPTPQQLRPLGHPERAHHGEVVRQILERIGEGRVYQACYTFPLDFRRPDSLAPHALALRASSPGDFGGYLRMGTLEAASSSPERFVRIEGRRVECRPMKGTRPRHEDVAEDVAEARALAVSEKDRAENVMIVDLMRNDIGRVCELGSVEVPQLFEVERYATVHQMTSTVRGTLRASVGPFGVLQATFPPGSMTGAPKVAACHLLASLETRPRGLYSGTIGWLGYDGVCEFSVVIRTLQAWGERARWDVGGGVVWDSTPAGEVAEALTKAAALSCAGLLAEGWL